MIPLPQCLKYLAMEFWKLTNWIPDCYKAKDAEPGVLQKKNTLIKGWLIVAVAKM